MKIRHTNKGLTLVESLVSILLLAITLTAGMILYFNADALMTLASHKKMAMELGNETLESLKYEGYSELKKPVPPNDSISYAMQDVTMGSFSPVCSVTVTDIPPDQQPTGVGESKEVAVILQWQEANKTQGETIRLTMQMVPGS